MSTFLKSIEDYFGTSDLYEALGVEKTAKDSELRRAYHRLSLKVHPDRVSHDQVQEATEKFQVLGKIYAILSDTNKRAVYDEDGTIDEEDDATFKQDRDWTEYWRLLFKKVTVDDIKSFEESYKGSEEERETLKSAYVDSEGNMDVILEEVLCATIDDEPRFRELIEGWIEEGSVPAFPAFVDEKKSKRKARKRKHDEEAKEAEEAMKEMGGDPNGGEDSLKALIKARQQSREEKLGGFFDSLQEKYCTKKPKTAARSTKGTSKTKKTAKTLSSDDSGPSSKGSRSKSRRPSKK